MITLVLGGARSGKSAVAERRARGHRSESGESSPIAYVATGVSGLDEAFDERIRAHRQRRGSGWETIEIGLGLPLSSALAWPGTVLVDSLGTWVAGFPGFIADGADLLDALTHRRHHGLPSVLVSDETGLGVHPATGEGMAFRDALGELNTGVAAIADEVLLVIAGRVLSLPPDEVPQ